LRRLPAYYAMVWANQLKPAGRSSDRDASLLYHCDR
jgi:hypothetical protein